MNRKDISGFTVCIMGYAIEIVAVCHIPKVIALYRLSYPFNTIFRIGGAK